METRVLRGRPLDDDGVAASVLLLLELESDARGKNLAMPSLSWSALIDLPYALGVITGREVMLS